MKFFLPAAEDAKEAEETYEAIRTFNSRDASLSDRRIYRVTGRHNGKNFTATVGQPFERLGETVIAILFDTTRNLYLICSPHRGVLQDIPYFSGGHEITSVEDFEP
jgi:hypothetical protein